MDIRRLMAKPRAWGTVIEALSERLERTDIRPDVVAGVAVGGVPHSSAVAYRAGLPACFVRKQAKEYGRNRAVEGADVNGRRVALVEDAVTTGGSSLKAVAALRESGAEVTVCLAVAGYGFSDSFDAFSQAGVELQLLVPFLDLLDAAADFGGFPREALDDARRWWADPQAWKPVS
jgi:orotate phosphoribosyltransferase